VEIIETVFKSCFSDLKRSDYLKKQSGEIKLFDEKSENCGKGVSGQSELSVSPVTHVPKSDYDLRSTLLRKDISLKEVYVDGSPVEVLMINIKGP